MMGWGSGWTMWSMGSLFGVGHLLWGALLVAGIIVIVRWLSDMGAGAGNPDGKNAMRILMERYARGEIDRAEFEARKRDLT